jgi:tetratricopeptide (TPR) repeat protein
VRDNRRIEELQLKVERDPASIAFAQLAEEYRRLNRYREAVETARAGLARHPAYLSARVTLGRALIELGDLDQAERELAQVVRTAPDNLAALRGLGEVHHRRGNLDDALLNYEAALAIVRYDSELEQLVRDLKGELAQEARRESAAQAFAQADAIMHGTPEPLPVVAAGPRPTSPVDPDLRVLPVLERWLDCIVEDRQQRALGERQGPASA